jgi:hypothetical protein
LGEAAVSLGLGESVGEKRLSGFENRFENGKTPARKVGTRKKDLRAYKT